MQFKPRQFFELLQSKKRDYLRTFMGKEKAAAHNVLIDLADFCMAGESTFDEDPRTHARNEGRREVWLHVAHYLNLSIGQLYELATGQPYRPGTEESDQ